MIERYSVYDLLFNSYASSYDRLFIIDVSQAIDNYNSFLLPLFHIIYYLIAKGLSLSKYLDWTGLDLR